MPMSDRAVCFLSSFILHGAILTTIILNFDRLAPIPVIENTNKTDVISAVILGDVANSKILTKQQLPTPQVKTSPKATASVKPIIKPKQTDVIALKSEKKKPMIRKPEAIFGKDLLTDIEKQVKSKKLTKNKLNKQFEKTLQTQAEQSLRQKLLDEDLQLHAKQAREAQGEINKYQALIIQAISENWIVPPGANRNLFCELMIRIGNGGSVVDVQVTKTSGDISLDRSARAAVLKASPLPMPKNKTAFAAFKQFVLKVKPQNILNDTDHFTSG